MASSALTELVASQRRIEGSLERLVAAVAELQADLKVRPHLSVGSEASTTQDSSGGPSSGSPNSPSHSQGQTPSRSVEGGRHPALINGGGGGDAFAELRVEYEPTIEAQRSAGYHRAIAVFFEDTTSTRWGAKQTKSLESGPNSAVGTRPVAGLPSGWPASVKRRDFGSQADTEGIDIINICAPAPNEPLAPFGLSMMDTESTSLAHAVFSITSVLVLLHDLTVIPYALAWGLAFEGYLRICSIFSVCFWSLDICVSLSVGCLCRGRTMPGKGNIRQYLRTWFWLDIGLVTNDLMSLVVEGVEGAAPDKDNMGGLRMLRMAKLARLFRLAGFLRVLRIVNSFHEVFLRLLSEKVRVLLRVSALAAGILWFTHVLACAWFAVGRFAYTDTGRHWVDTPVLTSSGEYATYNDVSNAYQYLTAMHWALQQLALAGSIDTGCTNVSERLFNVVWLTAGFMFGSVFVSSLSASMVDLQTRQQHKEDTLRTLRRYLLQNGVEPDVGARVVRQVTERLQAQAAAREATVPALEMLSSGLRLELHATICKPLLFPHPLFRLWHSMDQAWFLRFCSEVAKLQFLREGDDLFNVGVTATAAHVLVSGALEYVQTPGSSFVDEDSRVNVTPGSWLGESALWCEWAYVGSATATSTCKLLTLDAAKLSEVCQAHRLVAGLAVEYCSQYHRRVVSARPPFLPWPTDLAVPFTDFGDLVCSMSKAVRTSIGIYALKHCPIFEVPVVVATRRQSGRVLIPEVLRNELMKEVVQGTSTVVMEGSGRVARVVALIAVRIEREEDASVFVQLGKWDGGAVTACCELPGAKCQDGEVAEGALQRMLANKLAPLASCVDLRHKELTTSEGNSGQYSVHTKYFRTIWHATWRGDCALPACRSAGSAGGAMDESRPMNFTKSAFRHLPLPETVTIKQVHFIWHQGKGTFYAWASPSEVEALQRPTARASLREWLLQLELPAASFERVVAVRSDTDLECM